MGIVHSKYFMSDFHRVCPLDRVSLLQLKINGAFLYRNHGPDYQNGLPEWTFICVLEYFSFCLLGQICLECTQTGFSSRII